MIFDFVTNEILKKVLKGILPVGKAKDADTVDGKHASDFLSTKGGTSTGDFTVERNGHASLASYANANANAYVHAKNNVMDIALVVNNAGNAGIYSLTDSKWILQFTADKKLHYAEGTMGGKTVIHSGNVGEHALPISGGTVRNTTPAPFNVDNLNAGEILSLIGFYANSAQLGLLGFYGANNPVFYGTNGTMNSLLHTGNSNKIVFTEDDTTAPADTTALWAHL